MKPTGRLTEELRSSAVVNLAVADAALLVAAFLTDHPGRSIVLFAVVNVVFALIWVLVGPTGKLRTLAVRAEPVDPALPVEPTSATRRRILLGVAPIAGVLAVMVAIAPESAAVLAGVPAGVGAGDLWVLGWVRRFEAGRREELLREAPASPFSGGHRTLYTRPMNEVTELT